MTVTCMKATIATQLRRLAAWLDPPVVPAATDPLVLRARVLVQQADQVATNGERKRHLVYAQLLKEFPDAAKRAVSRAIETGLDA